MTEQEYYSLAGIALKYTLSIDEAAKLFGIGEHKIRKIVYEHQDADFVIHVGAMTRIKRRRFEEWVDKATAI